MQKKHMHCRNIYIIISLYYNLSRQAFKFSLTQNKVLSVLCEFILIAEQSMLQISSVLTNVPIIIKAM